MIPVVFFDISTENVSTTIGYVKDIISQFSPIWLLIIGVGVALIVIEAIIHAIRH